MCRSRKVAYQDRIAALMALAKTQRSRSPRRNEVHAYRCRMCRKWHLTSKASQ